MTFLNEDLLARAGAFIRSRMEGQNEKPVIAYHGDGDGCCSAWFMEKFLGRPADFYWIATPSFDFRAAHQELAPRRPSMFIFLDMPVWQNPAMIEALSRIAPVFIYDHHQTRVSEFPGTDGNVLYINPVVHQDGAQFPTALFTWELPADKTEMEKEILYMALYTESWLKRIPIFGEFGQDRQDRLVEIARRVHSSFLIRDMSSTHYGINFLNQYRAAAVGKAPGEVMESDEYQVLQNIYRLVQNERKGLAANLKAEIRRLRNPSFIIKRIDSKLRLCGLIASEMRWKYPDIVTGIWQRWGGRYYCELRRGGKCRVNLAAMIESIKKESGLNTGGGHPAAAAFVSDQGRFFHALDKIRNYLAQEEKSEKNGNAGVGIGNR